MGNILLYNFGVDGLPYRKKIREKGKVIWYCPFFSKWREMVRRCYSEKQLEKNPSYEEVIICEEWRYFSKFRSWMETQDWEGKDLDKDLLGDGKSYSPDNCVFISHALNTFIGDRRVANEVNGLVGVTEDNGKYRAQCGNPFGKTPYERRGYIGLFNLDSEAHLAWKVKKHEYACRLADLQDDPRVAEALRNRYK